jgi:signal transduction histidine kinase
MEGDMETYWDPSADDVESLKALVSTADTFVQGDKLSPSGILETVYQHAAILIREADLCVALYDTTQDVFHSGITRIRGNRIDSGGGAVVWPPDAGDAFARTVIQLGKPQVEMGVSRSGVLVQSNDQSASHGVSLVGVRIAFGGKSLGLILVCTESNGFGTSKRKVVGLKALSDQAALALAYHALVDEREQTLKLLREQERKGEALERLAVVNSVAAEFAHRMNNIAGTIPARVTLIKETLEPTAPSYSRIMRFLDGINEDAENLLRSAHQIRSATELPRALEPVVITKVLDDVIRRIPVPEGVEVERAFDIGLPPVRANGSQLANVMEDLIRNAIEAVRGTGTVTVMATERFESEQKWVAVDVSDTGHGITSEQMTHVFDLFYTTKLAGTGFGLWQAKTFIQSLGGQIRVSSAIDQGTTFTLLLPSTSEAQNQ